MSLNAYARTAAHADLMLESVRHDLDASDPLPSDLPSHDLSESGVPTSHATVAFFDLCRMWGISDDAADRLYWDARADLEASL